MNDEDDVVASLDRLILKHEATLARLRTARATLACDAPVQPTLAAKVNGVLGLVPVAPRPAPPATAAHAQAVAAEAFARMDNPFERMDTPPPAPVVQATAPPSASPGERILYTADLAALLGKPAEACRMWLAPGRGGNALTEIAMTLGGRLAWRESDVERYMAAAKLGQHRKVAEAQEVAATRTVRVEGPPAAMPAAVTTEPCDLLGLGQGGCMGPVYKAACTEAGCTWTKRRCAAHGAPKEVSAGMGGHRKKHWHERRRAAGMAATPVETTVGHYAAAVVPQELQAVESERARPIGPPPEADSDGAGEVPFTQAG